jgi:hypothetical protein
LIWNNNETSVNTMPDAPSGLWGYKIPGTSQLVLNWNAAEDDESDDGGLSYNLRVGTSQGGSQIVAPMASHTTNGYRRLPELGNAQKKTTWTLNVPAASMYYFSVQAIDASFTGSLFATEKAVTPYVWGSGATGIQVANFPASIQVTDVQVISDGVDGVYVLWRDNRNGNYDIFLQHLNATGGYATGWSATPFAVCTASDDQREPSIALEYGTGVFVTWADRRGGSNYDIYAQRITASGTLPSGWTTANGKAICTASFDQRFPKVTRITTGAAFAWADDRGSSIALFARRVTTSGTLAWAADGVSPTGGTYLYFNWTNPPDFSITSDGAGGVVLAWRRSQPSGDLMVQRMRSSDGASQWSSSAHATATANVQIGATANGQYDLCYSKGTSGSEDLYYERLSSDGYVDVIRTVAAATNAQKPAQMVAEPTGGAVLGWYDTRSSTDLVYAHRILGNGTLSTCWSTNGDQVTTEDAIVDPDLLPDVTSDLHGGLLVAYVPSGNANNAFVRHMGENGDSDPAFGGSGAPLCAVPNSQQQPALTTRVHGKVVGAWTDTRAGSTKPAVYANELTYTTLSEAQAVEDLSVYQEGAYGIAVQWTEPPNDPTYGAPVSFELRAAGAVVDNVPASGQGTPHCYSFMLTPCNFYFLDVRAVYGCTMSPWATVTGSTDCQGFSFPECYFATAPPDETDGSGVGVLEFGWAGFGPNPASRETWVRYGVPDDLAGQPLEVAFFDIAGRRVGVVESGVAKAGIQRVDLNSKTLSGAHSQVVYLRVSVGDQRLVRRIVFTD